MTQPDHPHAHPEPMLTGDASASLTSRAGHRSAAPAISPLRLCLMALTAGLAAGAASWFVGESFVERFKPEMHSVEKYGVTSQLPTAESLVSCEINNAALAFAILGGMLGAALGFSGGLARGNVLAAGKASGAGLVLGAMAGVLASLILVPVFHDHFDMVGQGLTVPILMHAGIAAGIGAVAGLALGFGLGGWHRVIRCLVGGLVGGILGALLYEVAGAFLFPLDKTYQPLSESSSSRLLARLLIAFSVALGAILATQVSMRKPPAIEGTETGEDFSSMIGSSRRIDRAAASEVLLAWLSPLLYEGRSCEQRVDLGPERLPLDALGFGQIKEGGRIANSVQVDIIFPELDVVKNALVIPGCFLSPAGQIGPEPFTGLSPKIRLLAGGERLIVGLVTAGQRREARRVVSVKGLQVTGELGTGREGGGKKACRGRPVASVLGVQGKIAPHLGFGWSRFSLKKAWQLVFNRQQAAAKIETRLDTGAHGMIDGEKLETFFECSAGLMKAALAEEHAPQVLLGEGGFRGIELDRTAISGDRFLHAAGGEVGIAEIVVGRARSGIELGRLAIKFGGFGTPAQFPVDRSEVIVGGAILGIELDGLAIARDGVLIAAGGRHGVAQVVVNLAAAWSDHQGRPAESDGLFGLDVAQQIAKLEVEPEVGGSLPLRRRKRASGSPPFCLSNTPSVVNNCGGDTSPSMAMASEARLSSARRSPQTAGSRTRSRQTGSGSASRAVRRSWMRRGRSDVTRAQSSSAATSSSRIAESRISAAA